MRPVLPLVISLASLAVGCTSAPPDNCGAPAAITYDCVASAADAGAPGCTAGPAPFGGDPPDPDKTFPNGCTATLTSCSTAYPNDPERCRCEPDALLDGGLAWICPVK